MEKINVKVFQIQQEIKILAYLHKITGMPLGEIKETIRQDEYVLSCSAYRYDELVDLRDKIEEIKKLGASVAIYEDDWQVPESNLEKRIKMFEEIARDREEIDREWLDD